MNTFVLIALVCLTLMVVGLDARSRRRYRDEEEKSVDSRQPIRRWRGYPENDYDDDTDSRTVDIPQGRGYGRRGPGYGCPGCMMRMMGWGHHGGWRRSRPNGVENYGPGHWQGGRGRGGRGWGGRGWGGRGVGGPMWKYWMDNDYDYEDKNNNKGKDTTISTRGTGTVLSY